jgi:hypothetical protein
VGAGVSVRTEIFGNIFAYMYVCINTYELLYSDNGTEPVTM